MFMACRSDNSWSILRKLKDKEKNCSGKLLVPIACWVDTDTPNNVVERGERTREQENKRTREQENKRTREQENKRTREQEG